MTVITPVNSFAWSHQSALLGVAVVIPAIIESGILVSKIVRDPQGFKEDISALKNRVVESLSTREKAIKTVLWTLINLACVGAAAVLPFVLLPATFALPVAILAISLSGRMAVKGGVQQKIRDVKQFFVSSFTRESYETEQLFRKRCLWNVLKITAVVVAIGTLVFAGSYLIPLVLAKVSGALSSPVWSIPEKLLPAFCHTPRFAFIAYEILGALHLMQAAYYYSRKDTTQGLFHLMCALTGIVFPFLHMLDGPLRLHHSFTGLLLQLVPFRATKALGSMISFDSFLNCFWTRGYYDLHLNFHQFDFMNVLVKDAPILLSGISTSIGLQVMAEGILPSKEDEGSK